MEELYAKLEAIPDSYFGFIMGVIAYVKNKPERIQNVLRFIETFDNPTSSDVLEYISAQPDFFEDAVRNKEMVG